MDNETWIIEEGDVVITKQKKVGESGLDELERLIYWFWWADYMIRGAGDFENAVALEKDFQEQICIEAQNLGFEYTLQTFRLCRQELIDQYYDRFDRVCNEIRSID